MLQLVSKILILSFGAVLGWASAQTPAEGRLKAVGSQSLEQISLLWLDGYRALAPAFTLDIQVDDSSLPPKSLADGTAQLVLMSREMKPEEVAAFQSKKGYAPTRITVALDALVILVNKNNPIDALKIEQLDAMYGSTRFQDWPRDITLWGDLGLTQGGWAKRPIVLWEPPLSSGTRALFMDVVLLRGLGKGVVKRTQEEAGICEELIADQAAIGYGSMSYVLDSLKVVSIIPAGGKTAFLPSQEAVSSGAYPLSRFLYIYIDKVPGKPLPNAIAGYLNFALSSEGQRLLQLNGQVPLPSALLQLNRRRLN